VLKPATFIVIAVTLIWSVSKSLMQWSWILLPYVADSYPHVLHWDWPAERDWETFTFALICMYYLPCTCTAAFWQLFTTNEYQSIDQLIVTIPAIAKLPNEKSWQTGRTVKVYTGSDS